MNKILLIVVCCFSSHSFACKGDDIANFSIRLDSALAIQTDVAWRNQYKMVKALQLVPVVVELSIPRTALRGGYYADERAFLASLSARQRIPVVNLTLRLVGNWLRLLTEQHQRPELAGTLFAWVMNQFPLENVGGENAEDIRFEWRGWAHRLSQICLNPFPSLRGFETLEERPDAARIMLSQVGIFFTMLEPLSNRRLRADQLAFETLGPTLQMIGATVHQPPERLNWGTPWSLSLSLPDADPTAVGITTRGAIQPGGFWWIPAPEGASFADISSLSVLDVSLGDQAMASLVPLPEEFRRGERFDRHWLELLFYPLLVEAGMYDNLQASRELASVPPSFALLQTMAVDRSREIPDEAARDAAIAQIATAATALYLVDREQRVNDFLFQLLARDTTLTFAGMERIFRKYRVPVYLIAVAGPAVWPDAAVYPQIARQGAPPERYIAIHIPNGGGELVHLHRQFGSTAATNLHYLEQTTGILAPQ